MRRAAYDVTAPKRSVSLTLNAYITEHGSPAELAREHPSDDTA